MSNEEFNDLKEELLKQHVEEKNTQIVKLELQVEKECNKNDRMRNGFLFLIGALLTICGGLIGYTVSNVQYNQRQDLLIAGMQKTLDRVVNVQDDMVNIQIPFLMKQANINLTKIEANSSDIVELKNKVFR